MVEKIKAAFASRIEALDWMAPSTKEEALKKVEAIVVGVGYPDTWRDYSGLEIGRRRLRQPEERAASPNTATSRQDRQADGPQRMVDAAAAGERGQPAGAERAQLPGGDPAAPFFDPKADPAFNYGAIGSVIGHEISHSFDNNGALFDSTGALRNWWTPADFQRFQQAGDALAAQYDAYEALPGLHVNGKLTLGENIADVAGPRGSLRRLPRSLGRQGSAGHRRLHRRPAVLHRLCAGLGDQDARRDAAAARSLTDGHAPGQFRALTVRNLDAWYAAFNVKPGENSTLRPTSA